MQQGFILLGGILLPILLLSITLGVQAPVWRCIWGVLLSVSALFGIKSLYLLEALLVPLIQSIFSLDMDLGITGTIVGKIWIGGYAVLLLVGVVTVARAIFLLKKGEPHEEEEHG